MRVGDTGNGAHRNAAPMKKRPTGVLLKLSRRRMTRHWGVPDQIVKRLSLRVSARRVSPNAATLRRASCHISGCGTRDAANVVAGFTGCARRGVSPAVGSAPKATMVRLERKIQAYITQLLHRDVTIDVGVLMRLQIYAHGAAINSSNGQCSIIVR